MTTPLQAESPQDNIVSHVLNASDAITTLDLANEVTTILFAGEQLPVRFTFPVNRHYRFSPTFFHVCQTLLDLCIGLDWVLTRDQSAELGTPQISIEVDNFMLPIQITPSSSGDSGLEINRKMLQQIPINMYFCRVKKDHVKVLKIDLDKALLNILSLIQVTTQQRTRWRSLWYS